MESGVYLPYQMMKAEREEIMKLKWIESEKAGRDIGFNYALIQWVRFHKSIWQKDWIEKNNR